MLLFFPGLHSWFFPFPTLLLLLKYREHLNQFLKNIALSFSFLLLHLQIPSALLRADSLFFIWFQITFRASLSCYPAFLQVLLSMHFSFTSSMISFFRQALMAFVMEDVSKEVQLVRTAADSASSGFSFHWLWI